MFDNTIHQSPLIDFKGVKLNLIQINLDNSENSTKGSNISRANSKCFDDTIEEQNNTPRTKKTKNNIIKNKDNILNKKTKRAKNSSNSFKKNSDHKKSGKYKIILNLFN